MSKDLLYIGSQSKPRQELLKLADITYKVLEHKSEECIVSFEGDFSEYVLEIARDKMQHVVFPGGYENDEIFVLTADTLAKTLNSNEILCKPSDEKDAKRMLKLLSSEPAEVVTGCCLEKRIYKDGIWQVKDQNHWTTKSIVEFCIDDEYIDWYMQKMPHAINACACAIIEDSGQNFLKSVNGSYTNILGLPLYELRSALTKMGFKLAQ